MAAAYFVLRIGLGLVCLWAAAAKIQHFRDFQFSIRQLGLVPSRAARFAGFSFVGTELAIGLALLTDIAADLASVGASLLFAAIVTVSVLSRIRHRSAACHCFGEAEGEVRSMTTLVRAVLLLGCCLGLTAVSIANPPALPVEAWLPGLITASSFTLVVRYSAAFPLAMRFLRAPVPQTAPPTRRRSFRHRPIESSLREPAARSPVRSGLTMIPDLTTERQLHE